MIKDKEVKIVKEMMFPLWRCFDKFWAFLECQQIAGGSFSMFIRSNLITLKTKDWQKELGEGLERFYYIALLGLQCISAEIKVQCIYSC